ncbi:hypothetical protein EZV62_002883 [Acer yangbiense]|uniref:Protein kinase domain-containing protein n=1 Tax=Acer yangbiense TaxID=1000413 RepID=A0A5C7IZG2_9ROSI|nr:hypothetical protein EZV62_002883 [Acer yangbiense]
MAATEASLSSFVSGGDCINPFDSSLASNGTALSSSASSAVDFLSLCHRLKGSNQTPLQSPSPEEIALMSGGVGNGGVDNQLSTESGTQSSSIGIKGTVGYIAPEYGMGSDMSMSRDVYKFGILLLKMFMSRRPTDSIFSDGQTLHEFVKMTLLLLEVGAGINNVENSARQGEGRGRIEECLVMLC